MLTAVLLGVAIVVEVVATALLPRTEGFTSSAGPSLVLAGYAASIWLLTVVVRDAAGLGGLRHLGRRRHRPGRRRRLVFLGESFSWVKAASLALIVAGVVGLNLTGAH